MGFSLGPISVTAATPAREAASQGIWFVANIQYWSRMVFCTCLLVPAIVHLLATPPLGVSYTFFCFLNCCRKQCCAGLGHNAFCLNYCSSAASHEPTGSQTLSQLANGSAFATGYHRLTIAATPSFATGSHWAILIGRVTYAHPSVNKLVLGCRGCFSPTIAGEKDLGSRLRRDGPSVA